MKNKFQILDIVKVVTKKIGFKKINGQQGVVRGISQGDKAPFKYAYAIEMLEGDSRNENWFVFETDLEPLHQRVKEASSSNSENIDILKVKVDPRTGEGN